MKLALGMLLAAPAFADTLDWNTAFPVDQAPRQVYLQANYLDSKGMPHALQMWREGEQQLTRLTDHNVMISILRQTGTEENYQLYDLKRHTVTSADRSHLYRIGIYANWNGMAHILTMPQGTYTLTTEQTAPLATAWGLCHWYQLNMPNQDDRHICWSSAWALPLLIQQNHQPIFEITALDTSAPAIFANYARLPYTRIDTNVDIDAD
ncbi:hypothetical protein [Sulfuriferula nivalis]|uniref:hypothetical protein n=1 Tax=Sulfuriferula nivalis TaxID=2675298 RepID=UPI00138A68F3|nr:hypothetical protein [Sulfuriferula nivalis]